MNIKKIIIDRYKNALCDEYYTYLDVIKYLNDTIPSYAKNMGLIIIKDIIVEYPEFCRKFLLLIDKKIDENTTSFNEKIIFEIIEEMMYNKILENEDKTISSFDYDLDDDFFGYEDEDNNINDYYDDEDEDEDYNDSEEEY